MKTVTINRLCLDFQPPENLIEPKVEEYVEQMRAGETIEPVVVCFDGARYLLKDGFHRVEAARRLGWRRIRAEIIPGTREEMEAEFRQMLEALKRDLAQERDAPKWRGVQGEVGQKTEKKPNRRRGSTSRREV
jgi:ParB-like chromosome segregation protein Spo0J